MCKSCNSDVEGIHSCACNNSLRSIKFVKTGDQIFDQFLSSSDYDTYQANFEEPGYIPAFARWITFCKPIDAILAPAKISKTRILGAISYFRPGSTNRRTIVIDIAGADLDNAYLSTGTTTIYQVDKTKICSISWEPTGITAFNWSWDSNIQPFATQLRDCLNRRVRSMNAADIALCLAVLEECIVGIFISCEWELLID